MWWEVVCHHMTTMETTKSLSMLWLAHVLTEVSLVRLLHVTHRHVIQSVVHREEKLVDRGSLIYRRLGQPVFEDGRKSSGFATDSSVVLFSCILLIRDLLLCCSFGCSYSRGWQGFCQCFIIYDSHCERKDLSLLESPCWPHLDSSLVHSHELFANYESPSHDGYDLPVFT